MQPGDVRTILLSHCECRSMVLGTRSLYVMHRGQWAALYEPALVTRRIGPMATSQPTYLPLLFVTTQIRIHAKYNCTTARHVQCPHRALFETFGREREEVPRLPRCAQLQARKILRQRRLEMAGLSTNPYQVEAQDNTSESPSLLRSLSIRVVALIVHRMKSTSALFHG